MKDESKLMRALRAGVAALAVTAFLAGPATARSGGYSRPSAGSVRTPSASTFSAPSSSGYARPRERTPSTLSPSTSAGDMAINRKASQDALNEIRRRNQAPAEPAWRPRERTPSVARDEAPAPRRDWNRPRVDDSPGYDWPTPEPRRPRYRDEPSVSYDWPRQETRRAPPVRPRWGGEPSWVAPSWVNPNVGAGSWNPLFLWFLLDTLSRPGHAEWFRQHRSDPGYASWRAGADAAAARDPELKTRLDELDRNLGAALSGPADAGYLPPDVKRADAVAPEGGSGWTLAFVLVGVPLALGGGWYLVARRQRRSRTVPGATVSGVAAAAGDVVRRKLGVERDEPKREPFRIGQVVDLDATDFLLGEGKLLSKAPPAPKDGVTAVGRLDGLPLTRLYFGADRFLQVHLSDAGSVDECRLFNLHDTVVPDGTDGWLFWIPPGEPPEGGGPNEWSIGYPVFDTKDGTRWERVWSPGENLVEPFEAVERIESASGTSRRTVQTMLYARATGVPEPGPGREYLLLTAATDGDAVGVTIHVGIDISTAGLHLTN